MFGTMTDMQVVFSFAQELDVWQEDSGVNLPTLLGCRKAIVHWVMAFQAM